MKARDPELGLGVDSSDEDEARGRERLCTYSFEGQGLRNSYIATRAVGANCVGSS
jgi:hypothetical protein